MIVEKIFEFLTSKDKSLKEWVEWETRAQVGKEVGWAFRNQFMHDREPTNKIYISQANDCARKLAYKHHGYEEDGKTIDSRGKITFFTGDMLESMITNLARVAGVNLIGTGQEQMSLDITIDGYEFHAKPDGIFFNPEDKKFELVEIKSMGSYGFKNFERDKESISDSYKSQYNLYLHALGLDTCRYIAVGKDTGHLCERIFTYDKEIVKAAVKNIKTVLASKKDELPERRHEPGKGGYFPFYCTYCSYHNTCLVNEGLAEKVVVKNAYKLKAVDNG